MQFSCQSASKRMPAALNVVMLLTCVANAIALESETASTSESYKDCATKLSTLEQALYKTGDNTFQLNYIFYPPSQRTSRFIRVSYSFLNESGDADGCSISYIWAIGGFLFFQPPSLFQFNSLFFNYPNNDLSTLSLTLPFECRELIQVNASAGECSCLRDSLRLDILTQQVSIIQLCFMHKSFAPMIILLATINFYYVH